MAQKAETKNYLVFISHSGKDRWIAKQMANLIEEKGQEYNVKTFLDEKDIEGGDSISESIRENIEKCDEFLVHLSRYSIKSEWVLIEIGAAWGHRKRIIAIIDKVAPEEMPDIIISYKAIDLNRFEEYLEQLINRAKEAENDHDPERNG